MENNDALKLIASKPKGLERSILLQDDSIRNAVANSGSNVTIYCGDVKDAPTAKDALSDVYVGLIQRKNRKGNLDGLGALGGLAERTSVEGFSRLVESEKYKLIGKKDDVILKDGRPVITTDMDIIRKNNVLREMAEELSDLSITDIAIDPEKLELISMPKVKDDNYMINIWDGVGECYAVSPFCHIYKDDNGLIDEISKRANAKENGEATLYKKVPLFNVLAAYGHKGTENCVLEDGRSADKDYRYPHEYLASWALASKLMDHEPEKMLNLVKEVQQETSHQISFARIAKVTGQTMDDLAKVLHLPIKTVVDMDKKAEGIYLAKVKGLQTFLVRKY